MDNVGAHFNHTIFWKFLEEDMYYSKWWNEGLKLGILVLNVYHFFVRKWCIPRCITNLLSTFNSSHQKELSKPLNLQDSKTVIELLVIGQLLGCALVPGGHYQF